MVILNISLSQENPPLDHCFFSYAIDFGWRFPKSSRATPAIIIQL